MDFKSLGKALTVVGIVLASVYLILAIGYGTTNVAHTEPALSVPVRALFTGALILILVLCYFHYSVEDNLRRTRQITNIQTDGYAVTAQSLEEINRRVDKWRNARNVPGDFHVDVTSNQDGSHFEIRVTN